MLCPPELALPVQVLLPAFLLALGAGLASGTPGGIGAFEITMLGLLPNHPEAGVMGAILAWRITYFAIPAVIGGLIAALGPRGGRQGATNAPSQIALHQSQRAEVQLLRQGEHRLTVTAPAQAWLTARTNHLLVGLFDPIGATAPGHTGLAALRQIAATEGRIAVLYKCTARTAARARRHRQTVQRIAREAWVDPRSFNLATPARAGLRRKLRHATAAGVTITGPADTPAPNLPNPPALHLPLSEMARIAAIWAQTHGGERGFSTGRFAPAYVQGQRLYLAYRQNRLIAFITLHEGHSEWTLDLMRHGTDLPDGTMHLLVQTAIDDARRLDLPRLSLAAVPEHAFAPPTSGLARGLLHLSGGAMTGLARFKSSFAPHWQNLYLTAPHRAGLVVAALSIGRAILAPPPIQPQIEHLHEEYEFATGPGAWQ